MRLKRGLVDFQASQAKLQGAAITVILQLIQKQICWVVSSAQGKDTIRWYFPGVSEEPRGVVEEGVSKDERYLHVPPPRDGFMSM